MGLYVGILIVSFLIAIVDINEQRAIISVGSKRIFKKNIMISALLMYSFLFVLTACRDRSIGNDTEAYIRIFNSTINSGSFGWLSTRIEVGFRFYCYLIGHFSSDPRALLITSAIVCYLLTGIFIFSMSDHNGIMVALFIPLMFKNYCSGIRQAMAFSICLIAYMMIKKNKYYIGGLLIIIAATFHISALIALVYYIIPIVMKNKRFRYAALGLFITGIVVVQYSGVKSFFMKYGNYYEHYYNQIGREKIGFLSCALTMFVAVFIFLTYIYVKKKTSDDTIELNDDEATWFGLAILIIGVINFFSNNASRLMWYFELPFLAMLVDRTFNLRISERQKIIIPIIILYHSVFIISLILRPYYYSLVPYKLWVN